jgi:hypothetical protein
MAIATYTYDALPPAEQAALPPAEAIAAAFGGTGKLTMTARVKAAGVVEDSTDIDEDGMQPGPTQEGTVEPGAGHRGR